MYFLFSSFIHSVNRAHADLVFLISKESHTVTLYMHATTVIAVGM